MELITEVGDASVVDRQKLNKLSTEELAATLAALYSKKDHTVLIVDNPRNFFSTKNLMRELDTNGEGLHVILKYRGVKLTDAQIETIELFAHVKAAIEDQLIAMTPPVPPYPFADVPEDWSIETHIKFLSKQVRRAQGNTDYAIGYKTLERIWNHAAAVWSGNRQGRAIGNLSIAGYWRDTNVQDNYVSIGCQRIQRYELEQVAQARGWAFPEVRSEPEFD